MKVIEILKIGEKILKMLQESCIKIDDVRYIELYDEYARAVKDGARVSGVVYTLAQKYGISERRVYYIVKKMGGEAAVPEG